MIRARALRLLVIALSASAALMLAPAQTLAGGPPALGVTGAILAAPETKQALYGVNSRRELPMASATKLMTALIVLEHVHHLGVVLTAPDYYAAATDSQIGLVPGERMSVHDLLIALLLPSADDAAEDLAYNIGHRSVARFVGMMNARARELGLHHTHYATPIGLDTRGNYSSAADLVKLASYDLAHSPYFARVVGLRSAVLRSGNRVRFVVNRNDLVGRVPWIDGVKTGHTAGAGYVLVASGHRDGMTLVSAVLGTASEAERDADTLALLDYGFAHFHRVTPVRAGEVLARPSVRDRPGVTAAVIAAHGFTRVQRRGQHIRVRVQVPRQLAGPLRRHAAVGSATLLSHGRPVAHIRLLLARALPAVSGLAIASRFMSKPLTLLIVAVLLGVLGALLAWAMARRRRARATAGESEAA